MTHIAKLIAEKSAEHIVPILFTSICAWLLACFGLADDFYKWRVFSVLLEFIEPKTAILLILGLAPLTIILGFLFFRERSKNRLFPDVKFRGLLKDDRGSQYCGKCKCLVSTQNKYGSLGDSGRYCPHCDVLYMAEKNE